MKFNLLTTIIALTLLAGCESPDQSGNSKPAVKIGQDVVTEIEIEHALGTFNAPNGDKQKLKPTVTEALVTQKLLVQEAMKAGLDKKPEVVLNMATAQRQILAKAYAETLAGMNEEPSSQMVEDFYRENPNLFSNRRIYRLHEIQIEASQDRLPVIQQQLGKSKTLNEFVEWLKAEGMKGSLASGVKSSEQMSEVMREKLAGMEVGGVVVIPATNGLAVLSVAGVQAQPMTLEQAAPAIKKILLEKKQKEVLDNEVKRLRSAAKIEYMEGYAPAGAAEGKNN